MSEQDFIIVDGLLKKYRGNDTVVQIPDGVEAIGYYAFSYVFEKGNKNPPSDIIEKIIIPDSVVYIGRHAFDRCKKLKEINIPDGVKTIKEGAFMFCESLKEIYIPDSVETVEKYAFALCKSLKKARLPKDLKIIPDHMFECDESLTGIIIPEKVKEIGRGAFGGCHMLKTINIPKGLKKLDDNVFSRCGFEELDIPANVTTIEGSVLSDSLKRLIIRADKAKVSKELFYRSWEKEFTEVPPVEIYCTTLTKAGMPKNFRAACIDIGRLDGSSESDIPETVNIYKIDDKFLADQIIGSEEPDEAFESYEPPKNKIFKVKDGDKEFKVKTKFGNSLSKTKTEVEDAWHLYDMYVAEEHLLSAEEVRARIDEEDPNRHSDEYAYATPEVDKNAPRLDKDSAKRRFLIMAYIAEKLLDEKVLKKLADEMPRKKDGTFAKNKILRIASAGIVQDPCEILEIFAKADTDTSFVVAADFRRFSSEEVALIENDFISRNSEILELKFE